MVEQKDRFGELIGDALRDDAVRCHLPSDFTKRLLRGSGVSPLQNEEDASFLKKRRDAASPKWLKVAAMVAVMASFVAIAAVVGRVVLNAPQKACRAGSRLPR